jgi:hypothetical protein
MENVTKFKKLSKLQAGYLERDEFKDSNLKNDFFGYNCIYWDRHGWRKMHDSR